MKCRLCGKQLPLGTAECDNCGAQVEWKKYIWLTAVVTALAVALIAGLVCGIVLGIQEKPVENTEPPATENPTEATPEPTQTEPTDGTQPTEPTTEPTEPPTEPTTESPEPTEEPTEPVDPGPHAKGVTFVYDGSNTWRGEDPDLSECVMGVLYYLDWLTDEVFPVTSESVTAHCNSDYMVYYVKASEPMRIYGSPKYDLSQNWVVYETDFGEINYIDPSSYQYRNSALEIVEGNKRFVLHDLATGSSKVLLEMYYLSEASVFGDRMEFDGESYYISFPFEIWFTGILSEEREFSGEHKYILDCETGEIEVRDT